MTQTTKKETPLIFTECLEDKQRYYRNLLQVRILRMKLKEEKLSDKSVYESLKEKITAR